MCCPFLTTLASGSPIIQNGKLVGAVTHVLVANPTEGYGIFIENMLSAADNSMKEAAWEKGNIIPERFDIALFIICLDNASIAWYTYNIITNM